MKKYAPQKGLEYHPGRALGHIITAQFFLEKMINTEIFMWDFASGN